DLGHRTPHPKGRAANRPANGIADALWAVSRSSSALRLGTTQAASRRSRQLRGFERPAPVATTLGVSPPRSLTTPPKRQPWEVAARDSQRPFDIRSSVANLRATSKG